MGLEAGIWASRLRYGPGGWGEGGAEEEKKEEEEEEKIPHMCESIGHRPLRGRCPKRKKIAFVGNDSKPMPWICEFRYERIYHICALCRCGVMGDGSCFGVAGI